MHVFNSLHVPKIITSDRFCQCDRCLGVKPDSLHTHLSQTFSPKCRCYYCCYYFTLLGMTCGGQLSTSRLHPQSPTVISNAYFFIFFCISFQQFYPDPNWLILTDHRHSDQMRNCMCICFENSLQISKLPSLLLTFFISRPQTWKTTD